MARVRGRVYGDARDLMSGVQHQQQEQRRQRWQSHLGMEGDGCDGGGGSGGMRGRLATASACRTLLSCIERETKTRPGEPQRRGRCTRKSSSLWRREDDASSKAELAELSLFYWGRQPRDDASGWCESVVVVV